MDEVRTEVIVFADIKPKVEGLMLNIGSGDGKMKGYINVDLFNRNADASWSADRFPLNDCTVGIIQCHQTVEHFGRNQLPAIFAEWYRVLKPQGEVHITTPDIVASCKLVVDNPTNEWYVARLFGNQSHDGQFHKWGFKVEDFGNYLGFAGFATVEVGRYLENKVEPYLYVKGTR
jgi:SAM-dependent methyltransferase